MATNQRAIITAIAALCGIVAQRAPAQSSGSFAGDFVGGGVQVIPTITCATGAAGEPCVNNGTAFLGATIKLPGSRSKYLWISASLETALLTGTSVTGGTGKQSSTASGSIVVTPEVLAPNGRPVRVWPEYVTFDSRLQTLTANLSGCITNPDPLNPGGSIINCTTPEMIDLLLSTRSAHSYNFLVENWGTGTYTVKLHVAARAEASSSSIVASSRVAVGVRVGNLGISLVQVQTPFNSLCFDLVNGTSC
jgi:hypothetical protein